MIVVIPGMMDAILTENVGDVPDPHPSTGAVTVVGHGMDMEVAGTVTNKIQRFNSKSSCNLRLS